MKVGFVGVGNLGKSVAESMDEFYDVVGYDIREIDTTIKMADTLDSCVRDADIVFIAVPTTNHPDYDGRKPTSQLNPRDFDYNVAVKITQHVDELCDKNTLIVMLSTMLPGTTRRHIAPLLTNGRFIYNPNPINSEMIMIGTEDGSMKGDAEILSAFYQPMLQGTRVEVGTWEEVEAMKTFYSAFIATKLLLVNLIQDTAMTVGHMNVDVVTRALRDSTDGIMGPKYMKAGLGVGGDCLPRENIALRSMSKRFGFGYDLFDSIIESRERQAFNMARWINNMVPSEMQIIMLGSGFNSNDNTLAGSPVLLVGHYLETFKRTVMYDVDPNEQTVAISRDQRACYFLGQMGVFNNEKFADNAIVFDPWRDYPENSNCRVFHYGNTRTK